MHELVSPSEEDVRLPDEAKRQLGSSATENRIEEDNEQSPRHKNLAPARKDESLKMDQVGITKC